METKELLLTSCKCTQQWSAALWDYTTGNTWHLYKNGGPMAPNSVDIIGNDYLLSADSEKPLTHVWLLNSQEPIKKLSTILPDKMGALAVCPRDTYLAGSVGTKLYLWHLSSGALLSVQKKHYQTITCVKFSSDGNYVLTAGLDGMLIVYDLLSLVSFHSNYNKQSEVGQMEPLYTKHDHSTPITGIHMGVFGQKSRLASVSLDHTCKLYNFYSGQLLLSLVFTEPLTAVIFDASCWNLYTGCQSGKIQQFSLREPPRLLEHHVDQEKVFQGHDKRITCLDLNRTNSILASGSDDSTVIIWDIISRQVLRKIQHKDSITNIRFIMNHENFFLQNLKPKCVVKKLDRELNQSGVFLHCRIQDCDIELSDSEDCDEYSKSQGESELEAENTRLRIVNKELYDAAIQISRKYNNF